MSDAKPALVWSSCAALQSQFLQKTGPTTFRTERKREKLPPRIPFLFKLICTIMTSTSSTNHKSIPKHMNLAELSAVIVSSINLCWLREMNFNGRLVGGRTTPPPARHYFCCLYGINSHEKSAFAQELNCYSIGIQHTPLSLHILQIFAAREE